jgi:hypothetical protein
MAISAPELAFPGLPWFRTFSQILAKTGEITLGFEVDLLGVQREIPAAPPATGAMF